jgi:hypothetical protein
MAGDQDRWPFRIVGSHGEATAANFVQPHVDDRVLVSSRHGDRVEELGRALLLHLPARSPARAPA